MKSAVSSGASGLLLDFPAAGLDSGGALDNVHDARWVRWWDAPAGCWRRSAGLRTPRGPWGEDVGLDHGGADTPGPSEFPNGAAGGAVLQQVGVGNHVRQGRHRRWVAPAGHGRQHGEVPRASRRTLLPQQPSG